MQEVVERAQEQAVNVAVTNGIHVAAGDMSLKEAFTEGAIQVLANMAGEIGANGLCKLYAGGQGPLGYAGHKVGHFIVGGAMSAALNHKDAWKSFITGGCAGMAGEMLAEALPSDWSVQSKKDAAVLFAGFGAFFAGADVNVAASAARNAVENNFAIGVYYAAMGAYSAYTVYSIYQTYKENGPEAALIEAGIEIVAGVAGVGVGKVGFKVAGKIYISAEAAWGAYVATNPRLVGVINRVESAGKAVGEGAGKLYDKVNSSLFGKAFNKVEDVVDGAVDAVKGKAGGLGGRSASVGAEAGEGAEFFAAAEGKEGVEVKIFDRKKLWKAPTGTEQAYQVVQRNDIDWNHIRTAGDKRFRGQTNFEASKAGLPPELHDGSFATLHHVGQDARGPLVEASTRYHGVGKPGQRILHGQYGVNKGNPDSPIDRSKFSTDTKQYWKMRGEKDAK